MSFVIKHGLFKLNITDHYAILGVPLDADAKQIRLSYLKIAQKLHPDRYRGNSEEKKLASQILSKLVNPAYEQLSRKNTYAEYQLVLTQIGKRLAEKSDRITVGSPSAQALLKAGNNLDLVYRKLLKNLTSKLYQSLEQATQKIALISELNLVYLMLKHGQGMLREEKLPATKAKSKTQTPKSTTTQPDPQVRPKQQASPELRVASYLRRAKEYIEKASFSQAILELRDALKIDPNNSTCHGLLGQAYLRQNQLTMAKVHINKAYQVNPKDPVAIKSKQMLDKLTKNKTSSKTTGGGSSSKSKASSRGDDNKLGTSGIFGSLFGTKKK